MAEYPKQDDYIKAFSSDFQIVSPAFPTGSQQYFKVCALPPFKAVHMRLNTLGKWIPVDIVKGIMPSYLGYPLLQ